MRVSASWLIVRPEVPADLLPGSYEMTATALGFTTQVRTDITVNLGARPVLNVVMQAGDSNLVVRVSVSENPVDPASSVTGGNVSSSTVLDSPLNGRDWTQLATLQAGVTGVQTGTAEGGGNMERGFGAALSISGARPDQNNYRLDGVSINDYSNGAPGSVLGDNLGVDAVQQFSVLGSNYPAQFGRTTGGVINAITRSGTNAFHGSVYEFLRNSALDARNFFDARIPPFKRNQFGGALGGPIQKDRTFVFADYEGLRQSLGVTQVNTVPSAAARNGVLSTGSVRVDPAISRYLRAFYPLPNGASLGNGDIGIFSFAGQQVTTENYFTTKLDRKLSDRDSISGIYMRDNSIVVQPDAFDQLLTNVVSRRQLLTLHEEHIFSSKFLNAVRFGFNRAVAIEGGVSKVMNPMMADPAFGFIPGQFVGSIQSVPGLTDFGGGLNELRPGTRANSRNVFWNSFQWTDDVSLIKGVHTLQFGALVERMQDNSLLSGQHNGSFKFSSLSDFLTNRPRNFIGFVPIPIPVLGTRQTLFGAYVQDDIRLRKHLTLNAGLRYEIATVITEAAGNSANLSTSYVEHAPKRSYVMQWNLSAAREISPGIVVTLGYVGSRGVHFPYRDENFDMVLPALTPAGYLFPPKADSQKLNPAFGRITGMLWQVHSFFDALQGVTTKKVSHGIQLR